MELSTVYVGVKDMDRALGFYRQVFEREPTQEEARFSTFDVGAVDFALYHGASDSHEFDFGNNCVPNFEVDDVDAAHHRIAEIAPEIVTDGVVVVGDYRTFNFVDTEGNVVEVFSIDSDA